MSVKLTLNDGAVYTITNEQADGVNRAIVNNQAFIMFGQSTIAVSAIKHMDSLAAPAKAESSLPSGIRPNRGFDLPPDFYSEEAMAKRRAENKIKYAPQQFQSRRDIPVEVNQSVEMGDYRLEKK